MDRRNFVKQAAAFTAVSVTAGSYTVGATNVISSLIKPPKLKKGDTVGLITPASALSRSAFEKSVTNFEHLGFTVKTSKNLRLRKGFLAGNDEDRLEDLHDMFGNDQIDGIVCARGGYGSGRLLPMIDYGLIRSNPKVLVGYSDITALLFGIHKMTGLVCFHGPVGASSFTEFTKKSFERAVMTDEIPTSISHPLEWKQSENKDYKFKKINRGKASGQLIGGNLSLLVSLIGTPYDLDYDGKIIFIEDVGEIPYRIDRMLTQLLNAGKLQKAAGIALGVFKECDSSPDDPDFALSTGLGEVLTDRLAYLKIPVLYGLPFGHIPDNATLPLGVNAQLDVEQGTLTLLESGVT